METYNDIVNEKQETPIMERFSFYPVLTYYLYLVFYFFLTKQNKDFSSALETKVYTILFVGTLHLVQFLLIKYYYNKKDYKKVWFVIIIPGLLYLIFFKYLENAKLMERIKLEELIKRYKLSQPTDLVEAAPKPSFIIEQQKIGPENQQLVMRQHGGQEAPPLPHYQESSGAAPGQTYASGMPSQQYVHGQNNMMVGSMDPYSSMDYQMF